MANVSLINPSAQFVPGAHVRVKNTEIKATVIETNKENGRLVCIYFDKDGIGRDLFLPPAVLVLLPGEEA